MDPHIHETRTGWVVAYTEGWWGVEHTDEWFTIDEARTRYKTGAPLTIAEAHNHDDQKLLRCRWTVGTSRRDFLCV